MRLSRRHLGLLAAAAPLAPATLHAQDDPRLAARGTGSAEAPVVVTEFFSLTCGHCANFHMTVWPEVRDRLVNTGRVRVIWRDFPLDQIALLAAGVARAMPAERYEAFLTVLFRTQSRWAYTQGRQVQELAALAAAAGMDEATFRGVTEDEAYLRAILAQRFEAQETHQIRATPSFLFNGRLQTGGVSYREFENLVQSAPRA